MLITFTKVKKYHTKAKKQHKENQKAQKLQKDLKFQVSTTQEQNFCNFVDFESNMSKLQKYYKAPCIEI